METQPLNQLKAKQLKGDGWEPPRNPWLKLQGFQHVPHLQYCVGIHHPPMVEFTGFPTCSPLAILSCHPPLAGIQTLFLGYGLCVSKSKNNKKRGTHPLPPLPKEKHTHTNQTWLWFSVWFPTTQRSTSLQQKNTPTTAARHGRCSLGPVQCAEGRLVDCRWIAGGSLRKKIKKKKNKKPRGKEGP